MGCVAAASRMMFAFSRDGAVPGHSLWRRLNQHRTPTWSVLFVVIFALVITIPALFGNSAGLPVAFFAVTSITTIGLYIAYILPVFLRWRMGDKFEPGRRGPSAGTYRWINMIAIVWVALCVIIFCLPTSPAGVPWNSGFSWSSSTTRRSSRSSLIARRLDRVGAPAPSTRSRARSARSTSRTPATPAGSRALIALARDRAHESHARR